MRRLIHTTLAALLAAPIGASELSYTYVELGGIEVDSKASGTRFPATQSVSVGGGSGSGPAVAGSLRLTQRFYLAGDYESAVVDVSAVVDSPLTTEVVSGSYNWTATSFGVGWLQPLTERLDLVAELTSRSMDFDFGSFAGENFSASDSGPRASVGIRFNPRPAFELAVTTHTSDAARVDLSTAEFSSGTWQTVTARWYLFEDLGLGAVVRTGQVRGIGLSILFGFGELRASEQ